MTAKDIIKQLKKEGWYEVNTKGSHIQFRHMQKTGRVTVPMHSGDLAPGTLNSIMKQAGWK